MLWSIDTCQNKVSADQYHVTISRAQVGPYRGQPFFFLKLTTDQGWLLIGSQAQQGQTLTPEHKRGLIFHALSVARRGYTAMLRQQKLLTVDAIRVQVYISLAFFAGFNPGLT